MKKVLFVLMTAAMLLLVSCQMSGPTKGEFRLLPQPASVEMGGNSKLLPEELRYYRLADGLKLPLPEAYVEDWEEINLVTAGANYGWPIIAYGQHYGGGKIGEGTSRPDMEQPEYYWDPSMAPSGMMVYSGKLWPEWKGDFLVGSLKFDMISRLSGSPLREIERIEGDATLRVRDLREAPDGSIWMISEANGAIYRLTPAR